MKLSKRKLFAFIVPACLLLIVAAVSVTMFPYFTSTSFCLSCHEMNIPYKEYMESKHFKSASGVRAECGSCHIPREIIPKFIRKLMSTKEIYAHFAGVLDTEEKFEDERVRLAKKRWAEMKANNSHECRSCHNQAAFIFSEFKKPKDAKRMQKGLKDKQTCVDCHKGIVHKMPNLAGGYKKLLNELKAEAANLKISNAAVLYPLSIIECYDGKNGKREGRILAVTKLNVLEHDDSWLKVRVNGWQQDGVDAMIYELQGKRIFSVALDRNGREKTKVVSTMTDENTDQVWHKVSFDTWVKSDHLLINLARLWDYGAELHSDSCGICHSLPLTTHFLANQWIGGLKDMKQYISLDKEEYLFLQKYMQLHAQDVKQNKQ